MGKEIEIKKQETSPEVQVGSYNDLTPSQETLNRLGEFLQERYNRLKTFTDASGWMTEKSKAFQAYHMVPKQRILPYEGAANLSSPFSRIGVDAFHANVMSSIFTRGTNIEIAPSIIQSQYANTAKKAARYMTHVMNNEVLFYQVVDKTDKRAQLYGIGYMEPRYVREEMMETFEVVEKTQTPVLDPQTGAVSFKERSVKKTKKKKVTKFDGVKIDALPVESVLISPFAESVEQAVKDDVVFKEFERNFYDVDTKSRDQNGVKPFYIQSQVEKLKPLITEKVTRALNELEQARAMVDGFYLDMLFRQETVKLAQGYLWYDIDGDDIKEEITAIFHPESGTVLRVSLSRCRIVELVPRPVEGRFMGEGIPKICEVLDDEWETIHNTRANAGQWENSLFGFYRAGGRFNPQAIKIRPNHFYPVDDPREMVFPQKQSVGNSYFREEPILFDIFQRILAVDENFQGVSTRGQRSATETLNVSQRSSIRFGNPFNRIIDQLNKLLDHVWELNRECAPADKEFYIIGEDGAPLFDKMEKYDYNANLKFKVVVQSVFDQQLVRDTMLLAYRLFLVNPIVQQHPESIWELSQLTLDNLNIDIKLPAPPQAKVLHPFEVIEMFKRGLDYEPEPGMDVDNHINICMRQLNSEDLGDWEVDAVRKLILYVDKCKILKATLESANLNKSGIFPPGMMPQPGMTANRNPTQKFNTMRVNETGGSARQNNVNAMGPMDMEATIKNVLNQAV